MAKTTSTKKTLLATKHRAVCEDDSFKGPWRLVKDDAKEDARKHRSQPGNKDHVINIIITQTESMLFKE